MRNSRRSFMKASAVAAATQLVPAAGQVAARNLAPAVRVVVWDERQPQQKEAYADFLGNQIAAHLQTQPGLAVRSVALDDPHQGLGDDVLNACDVLIWWGHVRHAEITPETGRRIVDRIVSGDLSLIALHSAHWSTPFVEAMNERAIRDTKKAFPDATIHSIHPSKRFTAPQDDTRLTPYTFVRKFPDGRRLVDLHLPNCCFPAYRHDGLPSTVRVLLKNHPIAAGLPAQFEITKTEMYDEPFHVPEPDEVVLEEAWRGGEWFRSGAVWRLGKGRVFYFRPGHETYPVFKEAAPLRVLANAVSWLGLKPH